MFKVTGSKTGNKRFFFKNVRFGDSTTLALQILIFEPS